MFFFRKKEKAPAPEEPRLDWTLMERGAIAMYHRSSVLSGDVAWFKAQGYVIHELNGSGWNSPQAFHADVRRVLGFPDHYAPNLMSWVDCLPELPVPDEGGMLLVFRRYDVFAKAEPRLAHTILDSIETTSRRFMLTGRRLIALVQSDDPRLWFDRVGARPVTWNPREWTDADRGLGGAG